MQNVGLNQLFPGSLSNRQLLDDKRDSSETVARTLLLTFPICYQLYEVSRTEIEGNYLDHDEGVTGELIK